MGLYYSHLLVSTSPTARPRAQQIVSFLQRVMESGLLGKSPRIQWHSKARRGKPERRVGRNPFTGELIAIEIPRVAHVPEPLARASAIREKARGVRDFDVWEEGVFPLCRLGSWKMGRGSCGRAG